MARGPRPAVERGVNSGLALDPFPPHLHARMLRSPPPRRTSEPAPGRRPASTAKVAPPSPAPRREGKELILATKPFASDDTAKSWWYVLSTTTLLAASIAGTLLIPFFVGRLAASVLAGLLILRLFVIYHDQQHHAILPRSRVAEWFMAVFGLLALSPSSIWRASHNHHHNHNSKLRGSQIGSFPIMTVEGFRRIPRGAQLRYLAIRHPLTLLFGYGPVFLLGMCIRPFLSKPREHWDCLVALILHVAIGSALVTQAGWTALLLTQTLPAVIACGIGSFLFYVQHNFPGVVFRDKAGWTYEAAALDSSSFLRLGPIGNWFTANIGYHHIHHLNSRIPFYRLPETMRAIPELQNPRTITLHPADVLACLRLKVWDPERQCMVGATPSPAA